MLRAGRPPNEKRQELFEKCCDYIEENDECQYSFRELMDIINSLNDDDSVSISENWLQAKLVENYGEGIIVIQNPGVPNIVCFKSFAHKVLRMQWKEDSYNKDNEKERIINLAAAYILDDIQTTFYDTSQYPPFDSFDDIKMLYHDPFCVSCEE